METIKNNKIQINCVHGHVPLPSLRYKEHLCGRKHSISDMLAHIKFADVNNDIYVLLASED